MKLWEAYGGCPRHAPIGSALYRLILPFSRTISGQKPLAAHPFPSAEAQFSPNGTQTRAIETRTIDIMQEMGRSKRRVRRTRGTGLRTRTGCLTCRKRHKKCDERRPVCGPCSVSSRDCTFAQGQSDVEVRSLDSQAQESTASVDDARNGTSEQGSNGDARHSNAPLSTSPTVVDHENSVPRSTQTQTPRAALPTFASGDDDDGHSQVRYVYSPQTVSSELLTADLASTRWLDLLTSDAAQADKGFSLASTRHPSPALELDPRHTFHVTRLDSLPRSSHLSSGQTASESSTGDVLPRVLGVDTAEVASERQTWQLDEDICLHSKEAVLFRAFAERAALWLDLFDPLNHFSTHATRLALRNLGLMKAILALTSRHAIATMSADEADTSVPVQYYYETLHYVQSCLQFSSYTHSEELLATAIIISTYEMLDNSNSNWKRHLKGVFWIQRSQDVNGASGGLRQSVWWAWLRQDSWAAFREKRACLSFWRPVKEVADLTQDELADRAVYLLSQAVNYCADSETSAPATVMDRVQVGDALLDALDRWRSFLGPPYRPLPSPGPSDSVFKPIWIHPPRFAVALQVYNFALILVTLHRPGSAGFQGHLRTQQVLSDAVNMICGIAMELKDEGSQIVSAQCLFGAGLCTHETTKQDTIISLIRTCESRSGWPMSTLTDDLKAEWAKINQSSSPRYTYT